MSRFRPASRPAFTLIELLVVLGIIALLIALLMPAVMYAVNVARRAQMGVEISALNDAIEKYKQKVGDYPPNFRDANALMRHIRMRYPKIAPSELNAVFDTSGAVPVVRDAMQLDEGESLVFWLAGTRNDPRYPFGLTVPATGTLPPYQTYYEFDQRRLVDDDLNTAYTGDTTYTTRGYPSIPSFRTKYAKDTFYLYLDSRSYDELTSDFTDASTGAYAEIDGNVTTLQHDQVTRPYATDTATPMNPTSFQILCAGQDGEWGNVDSDGSTYATAVKGFPGGQNYFPADKDNITNFSGGRTLGDHIP